MDAYTPWPMQLKFHQCPAVEVFLGGAAGPGKTRAMLEDAIDRCRDAENWRDARFIYFRGTMDELLKVIDDSKKIISRQEATYNENLHRWTFHDSGAYLRFDSLHNVAAADSHLSEEYDGIYMDECGQLDPVMHRKLRARMRTTGVDGQGRPRVAFWRGASNPGGPAHMELLERFVRPADYDAELLFWWDDETFAATGFGWVAYPPGTRGLPREFDVFRPSHDDAMRELNLERAAHGVEATTPNSRCFIPGLLEDNPILYNDPAYDATLWELAGKDPLLYRAMRRGDWFAFSGQVFMEFDPRVHVIPPTIPMAHWPKFRAFDWGYTAPYVCLWLARNPDTDQVIVYREEWGTRKADGEICAIIKSSTPAYETTGGGEWKTIADPSLWAQQGRDDALTRADVFRAHGVPLTPANNNRRDGKARVHELLAVDAATQAPGLLVTANCHKLIETLPTLVYDPNRPEDVSTKGDDHWYDALRYGLMSLSTQEVTWGPGMRRAVGLRASVAA